MNNIQKRFLLFLLGCIPTRILLTYLVHTLPPKYLKILGYLLLFPAIGFTYIYLTNSRKTGGETFGSPIWWNSLRPIHAILYASAAYYAINNMNKKAAIALGIDVTLGVSSFLYYHYTNNSFTKLL